MDPHQPFITDPAHLAELAGRAYLCLRPDDAVGQIYRSVQDRLRHTVGDDAASWPEAHLSLKGFGTSEQPLGEEAEVRGRALVEEWAMRTPGLRIEIDGLDAFADERIPIMRIVRTPELRAALIDLRARADSIGLGGDDDRIPTDEWVFHLSLVYYEGDRWSRVEAATRKISVPSIACVVDLAELVRFDGGPERLLGRFPLAG